MKHIPPTVSHFLFLSYVAQMQQVVRDKAELIC